MLTRHLPAVLGLCLALPLGAAGAPPRKAEGRATKAAPAGLRGESAARRPLRIGVAYLGRDVREIDRIAKVADWVLLPMSEQEVAQGARSVRKLVKRAKARGLEVLLDPWRVGDVFAGEAESKLPALYPAERQVSSDGRVRNSLSPLSPAFQKYMKGWLTLAKEVGSDGVFWDEPHYWQGQWGGDARLYASTDRWHQERYGKSFPRHLTPSVARFQIRTLNDMLDDLTRQARGHGLKVYADFTPNKQHQALWRSLTRTVDSVGVSAYEDPIRDVARLLSSTTKDKAHVWLQAFKVPRGREQEIVRQAEAAYDRGVRELAFWSWKGSEAFEPLRSEDPGATQGAMLEAIKRLRDKR